VRLTSSRFKSQLSRGKNEPGKRGKRCFPLVKRTAPADCGELKVIEKWEELVIKGRRDHRRFEKKKVPTDKPKRKGVDKPTRDSPFCKYGNKGKIEASPGGVRGGWAQT